MFTNGGLATNLQPINLPMMEENVNREDSDNYLLHLHRTKPKLMAPGKETPHPARLKDSSLRKSLAKQSYEKKLLERLTEKEYLSQAIYSQYGGQARDVAINNYVTEKHTDPQQPRLIDDLLGVRTAEFSKKQQVHSTHLRDLTQQKERLLEDCDRIQQNRRTMVAPPSPTFSYTGSIHSDPGWQPSERFSSSRVASAHSVHAVDSLIHHTALSLPAQIAKYNRLREQFDNDYGRLRKPYEGDFGPQSYRSWQMEDYHMVRSLVEDLVDRFLDSHFRQLPAALDRPTAMAVLRADTLEAERRRAAVVEAKAVQLVMEELVLEESRVMVMETATEFLHLYSYLQNRTNLQVIQTAEVAETKAEGGRDEQDPAFPLVTATFYHQVAERHKYRNDLWLHTQPLQSLGQETEPAAGQSTKGGSKSDK